MEYWVIVSLVICEKVLFIYMGVVSLNNYKLTSLFFIQTELYALLREEEEAALAAAGEPMRNYLIHHIFPTLTPALLEVAKLRPEDPVDFLVSIYFRTT